MIQLQLMNILVQSRKWVISNAKYRLSIYIVDVILACPSRERGGAASEGELEPSREDRRRARHSRRSAENLTHTEDKWNDIQRRIRDGTYGT